MCPKPSESPCEHEWRLVEEVPLYVTMGVDEPPTYTEIRRRWYCVRCRTVETRDEPE